MAGKYIAQQRRMKETFIHCQRYGIEWNETQGPYRLPLVHTSCLLRTLIVPGKGPRKWVDKLQ